MVKSIEMEAVTMDRKLSGKSIKVHKSCVVKARRAYVWCGDGSSDITQRKLHICYRIVGLCELTT